MKKKALSLVKFAGVSAGILGAASYAIFYEIMHRNAKLAPKLGTLFASESGLVAKSEPDARQVWLDGQKFEEFEIINEKNYRLKGFLLPADEPSDVYVFCSHGYRNCGKGEFGLIVKFYHDQGYNVFLVDHQAAGESDGKYIGFGYHEYTDCFRWLDLLKERFGENIQIILHGISMGCATVTMMSGSDKLPDNVKFIVADCGYTSAYDEFAHNIEGMHIPKFPIMNISNAINKRLSGYEFKEANPLEAVKNAKVPMLFIHGGIDTFVPTRMVYELYDACASEDKKLLVVEGAGHAESYPVDSETYEAMVCEFAEKYIGKS